MIVDKRFRCDVCFRKADLGTVENESWIVVVFSRVFHELDLDVCPSCVEGNSKRFRDIKESSIFKE